MKVYIVIMHRYGDTDAHTYIEGVYKTYELAKKAGFKEQMYRGNKYCSVIREEIVREEL